MLTTTWIPCEQPPAGRKVARAKASPPWFASADRYVLEYYRSDGQLYACVTNKGDKPKGSRPALSAGESQWYLVCRDSA